MREQPSLKFSSFSIVSIMDNHFQEGKKDAKIVQKSKSFWGLEMLWLRTILNLNVKQFKLVKLLVMRIALRWYCWEKFIFETIFFWLKKRKEKEKKREHVVALKNFK